MAAGSVSPHKTKTETGHADKPEFVECGLINDWVDCVTAPETADNAGSTVTNPGGITRAAQNIIDTHGMARSILFRLKYDAGVSVPTDPVIQPFGFDANNAPQRLYDGNGNHAITITVDTTNDSTDGTYKYTAHAEVDIAGCRKVIAAIKTAFAGTGTVNNSALQFKVNNRAVSAPVSVTAEVTSVSISAVTPGTAATNLGKAEDAAHSSGDVGVMSLTVRKDTAAATSGTDGDYQPPITDSTGRLWTHVGAIDSSETHIGKVTAPTDVLDVTLSLDTGAYSSGDLLADTQVVTGALRVTDGRAILQSLVVIDEDDQKAAFTIYFLSANTSMGTENSAPTISDAGGRDILGYVDIATTDYKDLGGVSVANIKNVGIVLEAASGTANCYVAVVNGSGAPTYTASGVRLRLGLLQD